jgi:hypothetical protein
VGRRGKARRPEIASPWTILDPRSRTIIIVMTFESGASCVAVERDLVGIASPVLSAPILPESTRVNGRWVDT